MSAIQLYEGDTSEPRNSDGLTYLRRTPFGINALKKTVDSLALVPTRDRLSLMARKVYNVLMFHAQKQGVNAPVYRVRLREVINSIEFNSNNTEVLKEHLRQMVTTKVEWQSPTTGEGAKWGVSTLIAHAQLLVERGETVMEWSYAPTIKQAILDPERYARISLEYQSAFRTMGGLVLYEICARYVDNPGGVTNRQPWTWWRPVLTGSPEDQQGGAYDEWKYFKRDVIKKAVAEVNALTDLVVEPIEHKRGRSVADLQFSVRRRQRVRPLQSLPSPVNLRDIGRAIAAGIEQEKAEKLLERYGEDRFGHAVAALEKRLARTDLEAVRKPAKFLGSLLEQGRAVPLDHVERSGQPQPERGERAARLALLEQYRADRRSEAFALFNELPLANQAQRLADFETLVAARLSPAVLRSYKSKGISSPMVRAHFLKFLADESFGPGWETPTDTVLLDFGLARATS